MRYDKVHIREYVPRFCREHGLEADTTWACIGCVGVVCNGPSLPVGSLQLERTIRAPGGDI